LNTQQTLVDDELDIYRLIQLIWMRRWLVITLTALFVVGAVVLALRTEPVYRAQIVVTEVRESGSMGGVAGTLLAQFGGLANLAGLNIGSGDAANRNNSALLKSRYLAEEFVRRYELADELFRKARVKPTLWRAVEAFRGGVMTISEDIRQSKLTVAVEWTDPALAARWANDYVALANEIVRTRALDEATRNIAYLNTQIAQTRVLELQKVMYLLVQNEMKTLMLANARSDYAFAVVDPAVVPELRVRPARTLMVLTGGVMGFVFSVIIVLALYFFRREKFRLSAEVKG
jgi:uncharacterized protein involved in exopolysaccharide biosynthesis